MKRFVIVMSLALITLSTNAQVGETVRFGLTFAPQLNWLKSDNPDITSAGVRFGFQYGLGVDYYFADNYALATGFTVTHAGGKMSDRVYGIDTFGTISSITETLKLQYLDLPINFKLKTNEMGNITYFGQIGVTPSFRIRARNSFDKNLNPSTPVENVNIVEDKNIALIKSNFMNLSLTVGGGIEYNVSGETAIIIAIIFNNGFVSILDDGDDEKTVLRNVGLKTGVIF